jgi:hypothetical protein
MTEETAVDPTPTGVKLDKKKFVRIAVVSTIAAAVFLTGAIVSNKLTSSETGDNETIDPPAPQD